MDTCQRCHQRQIKGAMPSSSDANKDLQREGKCRMAKDACPDDYKDLQLGLGCASELMLRRGLFDSSLSGALIEWHQPCQGKVETTGRGSLLREKGAWAGVGWQRSKVEPTAASLLRASWQTGRPRCARSPPHALGVGQRPLGLVSQIPSACTPATGVAGGRTGRAVSVLSLRAAPKKGGKVPAL